MTRHSRARANMWPPRMSFVDWEVGVDLRDAGWSRKKVADVVRKYKLQNGQGVIFFNNARMFGGSGSQPPKARIYWMWNGQGVTIIPPVAEFNKQVDYQLQLNAWLRSSFQQPEGMTEFLDSYADRRRKQAERALKRRKAA